jgi:O-methyltransferase
MKPVQKLIHTINFLGFRRSAWFFGQLMRRPNPAHLWEEDESFLELYRCAEERTLTDKRRCYFLYQFAESVAKLPGDFAEIGVYRGGTAYLLGKLASDQGKRLHLFDTFEGMPPTDDEKDFVVKGDFADTSLAGVTDYLKDIGSCEFHPGFFPETAASVQDLRFSFVHVDVDMYLSALDCCEFFHDRLVPGGVMIFDDYGFITTEGLRKAVDQFYQGSSTRPLYSATGQCFVIRN